MVGDESEDLYEILQVHPSARPEVIEAAWRRLLRIFHPDVNSSPDATEKTVQINRAYEVLRDPNKRAAYDRSRAYAGRAETSYGSTSSADNSRTTETKESHSQRKRSSGKYSSILRKTIRFSVPAPSWQISWLLMLAMAITLSFFMTDLRNNIPEQSPSPQILPTRTTDSRPTVNPLPTQARLSEPERTMIPSADLLSSRPRLILEDGEGLTGETIPLEMRLIDVPNGVSGLVIEVLSDDPEIAHITGVTLPEYGSTWIGTLPSPSVRITIIDASRLLEGAIAQQTVATIEVALIKAGRTEIIMDLRILDDDNRDAITPDIQPSRLIVN